MNHTEQFYDFYKKKMIYKDARPNQAHLALAKLEKRGNLQAIITQNIDGLHRQAGSQRVLELHGSVQRNYCMTCGTSFSLEYILQSEQAVPTCDQCRGVVKPDVVLYQEALPEDVLEEALTRVSEADVLIVAGTSLKVYPAAALLQFYNNRKLILINKSTTPYDMYADFVINDSIGKVMQQLVQ